MSSLLKVLLPTGKWEKHSVWSLGNIQNDLRELKQNAEIGEQLWERDKGEWDS
jgi:hypothetical protein